MRILAVFDSISTRDPSRFVGCNPILEHSKRRPSQIFSLLEPEVALDQEDRERFLCELVETAFIFLCILNSASCRNQVSIRAPIETLSLHSSRGNEAYSGRHNHEATMMVLTSNVVLSLLFSHASLTFADAGVSDLCRSNATHICWPADKPSSGAFLSQNIGDAVMTADDEKSCWYQTRSEAEKCALAYLRDNIMPFDVANMETFGFVQNDAVDVDGLESGLVGPTVKLALDAKVKHQWADSVQRDIYYEYVLNYANVNEARTNWRPLLTQAIEPILDTLPPNAEINTVVKTLNSELWYELARTSDPIVFKAGQTPLIFDPMSVIAFGYGSCTGLSILFVNALRAAGIPARLVGTPAWLGARENGNHNWVEVYHDGKWDFMEPSAGVPDVDHLDKDPCTRWFCNRSKRYGDTRVFAARLDRQKADTFYPMAWEWNSTDVPGEDRTEYYIKSCSQCD